MSPPSRILLIRPSALGDVCRSVAVLASVKAAFPSARVDWLVQDIFADAVRHHPALHEVIEFPRKQHGHMLKSLRAGPVLRWLDALRRRRYDLVIDLQGLARSGSFAWATHAPRRVGFADARELGWLGYNERLAVEPGLHAVDREMRLIELAGIPPIKDLRLYSSAADRAWADAALSAGTAAVSLCLLAPTSRWEGKRWPTERFAKVASRLLSWGVRVAVVGTSSERSQCRALLDAGAGHPGFIDLIGKTAVGTLMAVVERADLVIANDSAPLHMAVGFDRPVLALFGPTRVDRVGPYGREASVLQHVKPGERLEHKDDAAGRLLMERIGVDEVLERAQSVLQPPKAQ